MNLPAGRALAAVLRRFWVSQAAHVAPGWVVDLAAWDLSLAEAVEPVLLNYARMGYAAEWVRIRGLARDARTPEPRVARAKSLGFEAVPPEGGGRFAALLAPVPAFARAVRGQALLLAAAVNRTTAALIAKARRAVLAAGGAAAELAARVRAVFLDRRCARRIAADEASWTVHAGRIAADLESGRVNRLRWQAAAGCCPTCCALDGQTRPLGEPFYVWPRPGPYQVVLHPPAHPRCKCGVSPVLA